METWIANCDCNSRSVKGVDFARQLAEHRRESQQPPTKKFKSSAAPKGTQLASGYQDRTELRRQLEQHEGADGDGIDDKEKRVRALEEMVKLGQIDQATFEKLRREIGVGGDINSTHLVKGLDWDLLRRVKAGEDVTKPAEKPPAESEVAPATVDDVDEELDRILEEKAKDIQPAAPKEKVKKGNMAPPPQPSASEPGKKMSRDEILRQLKASRAAAAAEATAQAPAQPSESSLGSKFKKIGDNKGEKKRWIEQDASGRRKEVLITTGPDGKTKRKVRWLDKPGPETDSKETDSNGLLVPDKNAKPLGMEVPARVAAKAGTDAPEPEDEDIFEGVGTDYNPLADLGGDDSSSESEKEEGERAAATAAPERKSDVDIDKEKAAPQPSKPRNYFSTSTSAATEEVEPIDRANPLTNDPTVLAALKRAAALRQASPSAEAKEGEEDVDPEILARRKKFLEEARRREELDSYDIDYGFGSSRIEDDEDEEVYGGRGGKRKRGKKRKGDKDSAADVLRVLEARRQQGSS